MSESDSDLALLLCPLKDPLLDGALTDKTVDSDLLGLPQPVSSIHGLLVHCGVPVAVIEDDLGRSKTYVNSSPATTVSRSPLNIILILLCCCLSQTGFTVISQTNYRNVLSQTNYPFT